MLCAYIHVSLSLSIYIYIHIYIYIYICIHTCSWARGPLRNLFLRDLPEKRGLLHAPHVDVYSIVMICIIVNTIMSIIICHCHIIYIIRLSYHYEYEY